MKGVAEHHVCIDHLFADFVFCEMLQTAMTLTMIERKMRRKQKLNDSLELGSNESLSSSVNGSVESTSSAAAECHECPVHPHAKAAEQNTK
jgi:hypothetical protein